MDWKRLDDKIGEFLTESWSTLKDWWSSYTTFFSRFQLSGTRRAVAEVLSESFTLGTAGFAVLFGLALPAFDETDEEWRTGKKYSITFLDRYGNEIGKRGILQNDAVPLDEIPDYVIKAVLATEDRRFFDHFGIDPWGTFRALVENVRASGVVQGGSTITQQLAKNLFLTSERSLRRKIKEAFLALWLEARLTKEEILKLYFDRAYMGGGAFGLEAAAQFYFGKSIRDVTLSEAAMLAGLFKAPTKYAPHTNLPAARARANEVLTNLVEAGFMTEGQVHGARLNPAKARERPNHYSPDYFLDWAYEELKRLMKGKEDRVLIVRTTVDVSLQRLAEQAIKNVLRQYGRAKRVKHAAMVAMETNGAVRALVGGPDYGESQFNRATQAKRQPGSTFKPYVYFTAIQHGFKPTTLVPDRPVWCGRWSPQNFTHSYRGWVPMGFALMKSINTVAVYLANKVGRKNIVANTRKLGLKNIRPICPMPIGTEVVTLLDHTSAYATFANGGYRAPAYGIEEIRNSQGALLYSHERDEPPLKRIFEEKHVALLNSMMSKVASPWGTARRAYLDFTALAGKTGTTNDYRDAWFMGFTGKYVAGVWFGNDNYRPMNRVFGGTLPAMVWHQFMQVAHVSRHDIPKIPGVPLHPKQVEEMKRIAAAKKADPTLGTQAPGGRGLSKQTRQLLLSLAARMRKAKTLKPLASDRDRRAALSP